MKSYFLDTSVIINFLIRGKRGDIDLVNSIDGELTSSYICLAELYEGIFRTKNRNEEENTILRFFTKLNNIFGIDHQTAQKFGQIRADLKTRGKVIGDIDTLIAATCIVHDLTLITHNPKHFARILELKIYQK